MVITNGYTNTTPHHRQNRRRERPGSRIRRIMSRKNNLQYDCHEGLVDAKDPTVYLPSDKCKPSPLLHQNYTQSWQRWKAREAEEKALQEMEIRRMEQEQRRLFGGDVDDDELIWLEICQMDVDEDFADEAQDNLVCDILVDHPQPSPYVIRHSRRRQRRKLRKPQTWRSLPLHLSQSPLHTYPAIAQYLSPTHNEPEISVYFPSTTIQHRPSLPVLHINIPQSLPPSPPSHQLITEFATNTATALPQYERNSIFISNPSAPSLSPSSSEPQSSTSIPTPTQESSGWIFITNTTLLSSPSLSPSTTGPSTPTSFISSSAFSSDPGIFEENLEDKTEWCLFD